MLEPLIIEETEDTPKVILNKENNTFEIEGKSLPENSSEFYSPILGWILEYAKNPNKSTHLICKIEYLNSSSARRLYELFNELEKIPQSGNEAKVSWYYEDGDRLMKNKGNEFKSIVEIPFNLIPE